MYVTFLRKPVRSHLNYYWFVGIKYLLTVEIHYTAVTMSSYRVAMDLQLASYNGSKLMEFCQLMTSVE